MNTNIHRPHFGRGDGRHDSRHAVSGRLFCWWFSFGALERVAEAFLFMALTAILFTALGSAIGATLQDMQAFQFVVELPDHAAFSVVRRDISADEPSKALAIATSLDPLTYGVDGLRQSLIAGGHFGLITDLSVLTGFAVLLVAFGGFSVFQDTTLIGPLRVGREIGDQFSKLCVLVSWR